MMNPLQNHHFILSTVANDTRQKITQFFQDELEKKMTPRVSIEAQQLKCMHEDLELKRKCSKRLRRRGSLKQKMRSPSEAITKERGIISVFNGSSKQNKMKNLIT